MTRPPARKPPKAETLEVLEAVPWTCFAVAGIATAAYAWRGDITGVRYTLALAAVSVVAAGAMGVWQDRLERAERQARFDNALAKARETQRGFPRPAHAPHRRTIVNAELPPQWRQASHEPPH